MRDQVAVFVRSQAFSSAYVDALSARIGADRTVDGSGRELSTVPATQFDRFHGLVVDAGLLEEGVSPTRWVDVPVLIVLQCGDSQATTIAAAREEHPGRLRTVFEPGYIPERGMMTEFGKLGPHGTWRGPSRHREPVPDEHPSHVRDALQDEDVVETLQFFKARIHGSPERLGSLFATETTKLRLPETNSRSLPQAIKIRAAVRRLTAFLLADTAFDGRLILGEKGSGKTTLVHYSMEEARKQNNSKISFLPLSVDYQWIAYYDFEEVTPILTSALSDMLPDGLRLNADSPETLAAQLEDWLKDGTWARLRAPSFAALAKVRSLLRDPAIAVGLYQHFEATDVQRANVIDDYGEVREKFISDVERFTANLASDPARVLLAVLVFSLDADADRFEHFTWTRLVASLEAAAQRNPQVKATLDSIDWYVQLRQESKFSKRRVARSLISRDLHFDLLAALAEHHRLVIFFDNSDQRHSLTLEARVLRDITALADELPSLL